MAGHRQRGQGHHAPAGRRTDPEGQTEPAEALRDEGPRSAGRRGGVDFEIKPASESGIATFVSKQWGKPGWTRHIRLFVYDAEANVYEVEFQTILEEEYNALGR